MKTTASDVRCGDTIIIPSVRAVVVSKGNADSLIPNISDHMLVTFEVQCNNGPFRGFKGQCVAVGTDKLNIVRRLSKWERLKKGWRKFWSKKPNASSSEAAAAPTATVTAPDRTGTTG